MHNVMLGKEPRTRVGLIDPKAMRAQTQAALARLHAACLQAEPW